MAPPQTEDASRSGPIRKNRCRNCNAYVSQQFARVFGNNQDRVEACIQCSTLHALRDGNAGAGTN
jgi:predicted  nucleic acid-binding Zn-ribbon protein